MNAVSGVARAILAQIVIFCKAPAIFRLKDGAGLQCRFKINRFVSLCGLGHHRAGGNGTAFSANGEDSESVAAFKAKHAAFQLSAERSVQRQLTLAVLQIPKDVVQSGTLSGITVVNLQMERDRMHRKQSRVDKIDSELRGTAAYDPLRGKQCNLQSHHGRK